MRNPITKNLVVVATLAAALASPAFAKAPRSDLGSGHKMQASEHRAYGWRDSPYAAFAAVPLPEAGSSSSRAAALTACTTAARKYSDPTWGDMELHQYRSCMAEHGQPE